MKRTILLLIIQFLVNNNFIHGQPYLETQKDSTVNFYRNSNIEIDSVLQITHKDTVKAVKAKINGLWHYQGKKEGNKMLTDTFSWSNEGILFVREGILLLLKNGVERETDSIEVSFFDFSNELQTLHTIVEKSRRGWAYDTKSCQTIYKIAYHNNQLGLYGGLSFKPIRYLDDKILIIEVEKEWGFEYRNNENSTVKIRKEFEYFIRKN